MAAHGLRARFLPHPHEFRKEISMHSIKPLLDIDVRSGQIGRTRALLVHEDGSILVAGYSEKSGEFSCDRLQTSDQEPIQISPGDTLLVWLATSEDARGVVLGRIGPSSDPKPEVSRIAEQLVVEAKKNMTLKCGDSSITLREDGKILIKGKDLLSYAKRLNRIKGGAVAIN